MVRLLSSTHLLDLDKWQICGCPECLAKDGLEVIEVFNPETQRYIRMLAPWGQQEIPSPRLKTQPRPCR